MIPGLRILNSEPERYSEEARAILEKCGTVTDGPLSRIGLLECVNQFEVLIVRLGHQIDCEVIERADHLKAIVTATTGLDHIDIDCAKKKNIAVLSLKGEIEFLRSIPATAEHTWALLLGLIRNLVPAHNSVLAGEWARDRFRGHDLAGKTLGVLGLGRIGEKIARYGQAFGMRVIGYDPYREDWLAGVERISGFEDFLRLSQVLSIHVPLNEETQNLISARELRLLPAGAVLVNTARGQVVDEGALISVLKSGHLAGAALDVICGERSGNESVSPLITYARTQDHLLITPHIGGATSESMHATEIFMAHKLENYLSQIERASELV